LTYTANIFWQDGDHVNSEYAPGLTDAEASGSGSASAAAVAMRLSGMELVGCTRKLPLDIARLLRSAKKESASEPEFWQSQKELLCIVGRERRFSSTLRWRAKIRFGLSLRI
jgi:hypothetical protein